MYNGIRGEILINYANLSDDDLAMLSKSDTYALEYLLEKYKGFIRAKTRPYFLIGADREDIIQEGMIGLYKAVRDFDTDKNVAFRTFADLCTTRQIITAIKTANRQKHIPLNSYVSLNKPIFNEETDRTLLDVISHQTLIDPEEILIHSEDMKFIENKIDESLSQLEQSVLNLYLQGKSYREMSAILKKQVKTIDNALQRVKKKLDNILAEK